VLKFIAPTPLMKNQSPKLFIPGPIHVSEKTWKAFCSPMIGHRSKDFQELYARVQPGLQELFATRQPVFVATGSAWSVMEASLRNLGREKSTQLYEWGFFRQMEPGGKKMREAR
jgi:aspartate aminotransferase-like enzyme